MRMKVVKFKDLKTWSFALQTLENIKSKFLLIALKEVVKDLSSERKIILKDNIIYKEPTISSTTNTISARKIGKGSEFKIKNRIMIKKGDLVLSKMHTQNGLYAIADDDFTSTQTFLPLQILSNKINPDFLFFVLKKSLSSLNKFDSVNRETYKTDEILNISIPLPPLEIQNKIVDDIKAIDEQIANLEKRKKQLKDDIELYIYI